jgi:hypothetical protein
MANESLDEYRLRQVEESTKNQGERLGALEKREELRDVTMLALKASTDRNSVLVAGMILAIVGAALSVFFGVGR